MLIFRGVAGFLALLMFFYNISQISLAEAMTFSKTSPIFTAIFAYIFVKEKSLFKVGLGYLLVLLEFYLLQNLMEAVWTKPIGWVFYVE